MRYSGKDVENSEALQAHKEMVHAAAVSDKSVAGLETPDLLGDTPEESAAVETPLATH
jgi:hypothetical protein